MEWVPQRPPDQGVVVFGLSGSGHDWSIRATTGEFCDDKGRLISIDTPLAGSQYEASCRKRAGDFGYYVSARMQDGLFCGVPTGEKGL